MTEYLAYKKKRRTAVMILVAVCVICAVIGPWSSVKSLRNRTLNSFYEDMGIHYDLEQRRVQAYSLATLALNYLSTEDEAVNAVLSARTQLIEAESISGMYDANSRLTDAVTVLDSKLRQQPLTQGDEKTLVRIMAELTSRNSTIGHNDYNEQAAKFNDILSAAPAGTIASLLGVDELELFR